MGAAQNAAIEAGADADGSATAGAASDGREAGPLPLVPFHTDSRWIMDASNRHFTLTSVVWYGADSPDLVPAGCASA